MALVPNSSSDLLSSKFDRFAPSNFSMKKLLFLLLPLLVLGCAKKLQPAATEGTTTNSPAAQQAPYVILISLDGFRWDYVQRFRPPHLSRFVAGGVQAESLIPCFPSKTFPNHYSIATGMYPEHHGLVDNSFFSPAKNAKYYIGDREKVQDGSWYGGTPLWVLAEKSGMVSASYFFVGSEADVQGVRPSHYHNYDGSVSNEVRVETVLQWLHLPEAKRPHFIAMYFSDMDDIGHAVGPNDDEKLREKLLALDAVLGQLFDGVNATGLPVNIVIVSDHGMAEVPVEQLIPSESIENDELYRTVSNGAIAHLYLHDGVTTEQALDYLRPRQNHWAVYPTAECPAFEFPMQNPNWGDLQVLPELGWYFMPQRVIGFKKTQGKTVMGEHGYDPAYRDLHGIFYANGPAFRPGLTVPSVKNVHIYPVICRILGLPVPADVDGKLEVLEEVLR